MVTSARRRLWFGSVVLLLWAGVLAWHVKREYFRPLAVRLAEASATLIPANSFYSVKLGDSPIGYASSRLDTLSDGFSLEDELRLRITALGGQAPALARTRIKLGRRLDLQQFTFNLKSDFGEFNVEGAMAGDTALRLVIAAGGEEQQLSVPTGGPIVLPQVMPLHFVLGSEPEPGASYDFEIFDPSVLERQRVTLKVIGRETLVYPDSAEFDDARSLWLPLRLDTVETWHLKQSFGGIELDSWLDRDGQVVRATSPLGYTIERTAFEIAWNDYLALDSQKRPVVREAPDIIEQTAIAVGVDLPRGERLDRLAVRLSGVDLTGFDLAGERQRLRGDTLIVEPEPPGEPPGYQLPADPNRWREELKATPLIQSEDPRIASLAREVVSGARDPGEAAERLNRWVYDNLEKKITLSVPSALQVLDARRGDCNEHTVLYVALARAAGLPTRTAAGLVYVRDRFYYHAWPEVWLGRWVPVDPTLGQFPADASHLRFIIGGLARQVELVRLIGSLQLDVISVEER